MYRAKQILLPSYTFLKQLRLISQTKGLIQMRALVMAPKSSVPMYLGMSLDPKIQRKEQIKMK